MPQQIQIVAVDSKVPVFSCLNTTSRFNNSESQLEDTRKGLHFFKAYNSNAHNNTDNWYVNYFQGHYVIPLFHHQ